MNHEDYPRWWKRWRRQGDGDLEALEARGDLDRARQAQQDEAFYRRVYGGKLGPLADQAGERAERWRWSAARRIIAAAKSFLPGN